MPKAQTLHLYHSLELTGHMHCAEGEAEGEVSAGTPRSLEMENARLRAEVATQYAHEAARSLLAGDGAPLAASMQRSLQIGDSQVRHPESKPLLGK